MLFTSERCPMPVVHRYKKGSGLYIRARQNGAMITYQVTKKGASVLQKRGCGEGSKLTPKALQQLAAQGHVHTGGSGPGRIETPSPKQPRRKQSFTPTTSKAPRRKRERARQTFATPTPVSSSSAAPPPAVHLGLPSPSKPLPTHSDSDVPPESLQPSLQPNSETEFTCDAEATAPQEPAPRPITTIAVVESFAPSVQVDISTPPLELFPDEIETAEEVLDTDDETQSVMTSVESETATRQRIPIHPRPAPQESDDEKSMDRTWETNSQPWDWSTVKRWLVLAVALLFVLPIWLLVLGFFVLVFVPKDWSVAAKVPFWIVSVALSLWAAKLAYQAET